MLAVYLATQHSRKWYDKHNTTPFIEWQKANVGLILPTGGCARNYSALTVESFQKISMLVSYVSGACLEKLAPCIKIINEREMGKNSWHWRSVACRLNHYRRSCRGRKV